MRKLPSAKPRSSLREWSGFVARLAIEHAALAVSLCKNEELRESTKEGSSRRKRNTVCGSSLVVPRASATVRRSIDSSRVVAGREAVAGPVAPQDATPRIHVVRASLRCAAARPCQRVAHLSSVPSRVPGILYTHPHACHASAHHCNANPQPQRHKYAYLHAPGCRPPSHCKSKRLLHTPAWQPFLNFCLVRST